MGSGDHSASNITGSGMLGSDGAGSDGAGSDGATSEPEVVIVTFFISLVIFMINYLLRTFILPFLTWLQRPSLHSTREAFRMSYTARPYP